MTRLAFSLQGSGQHYTPPGLVEELLHKPIGAEPDPRQVAIWRRLTRMGISDPTAGTGGQLTEAARWLQLTAVSAG